jgi:hypothetical protein
MSGCSGAFTFGRDRPRLVTPPGATVVEAPDETTVVEPSPTPQCFARARRFNGLVAVNCADLSREIR